MIALVRRRMRTIVPVLPSEVDSADGIAYSVWLPDAATSLQGGVVVLHGAGSCKENHYDFARGALAAGFTVLAYDQRGHGESAAPLDDRALADVARMAALLRSRAGAPDLPLALRGSSMGGYLALVAAELARVQAVVAICPASAEGLRRALLAGTLSFDADVPALEGLLSKNDESEAVQSLDIPILLLHAEGDEQAPVQHSRELAQRLRSPRSRLIALPGGHHRSIQHDPELRAVSLRFLQQTLV